MKDKFDRELNVGDDIVYCTRHSSSMTLNYAKVISVEEDRTRVQPLDKGRQIKYRFDSRTNERIPWQAYDSYIKTPAKYKFKPTGEFITVEEHAELQREYWRLPHGNKPDTNSRKSPYAYQYVQSEYYDYFKTGYDLGKQVYIQTPRYVIKLEPLSVEDLDDEQTLF